MESAYEFDAPKYWMDFETVRLGVEEDDNADLWFSEHAEFEEGTFLSNPTEERSFSSNFTRAGPTVKEEPRNEATTSREDAAADATAAPSKEVRKRKKPVVVKTEEVSKESSEPQPAVKLGRKRSAAFAALKTPIGKQQRVQRDSAKKAAASIHSILKTSQHKPAVASHHSITARTPDHLRRYLAKKQGQVVRTRDQVEAEEMEKMQEETRKKLRQNRKSFRRLAISSKRPTAVKFTKPTTDAIGFKFRTDRRCRKRAASASRPKMKPHSSGSHPSNFPMTLRSDSTNEEFSQKKSTAVKPFIFQLNSRLPAKRDEEKEEETKKKGKGYVPTAEYLYKFETATPERFRTLSRRSLRPTCAGAEEGTHSSVPASSSGVTMPYTPKLRTLARARPTIIKSAAELEEDEMARIRENPFKSQPLDPKVFGQQGLLGVPKKPHHPATSPHTPKLATRERGEVRKEVGSDTGAEDEQVLFKAQPLPKGMFERVLGVPKKKAQPVTHPESPELALKRRNLHRSTSEDEEECQGIVANPMPDFSHKFEPQLPHRKTEIEPFAFEERYKDKPTRETLVQQILRREKRQPFKANPIPDFDVPRPVLPQQPITEPKTPVLQTKARGNEYESKWRQKLEDIAHKAKENTEFLAKDAAVLYKAPFTTVRTERPLLEVSNFLLHTELRKEQRSKFDAEREQKELQREQENREQQAMAEAKEAKKVASLRRSLVHKASRIHHYAPTMIAPSSKPLTAPQSPHFHIKFRELH